MIILDENIAEGQREILTSWHIRARQVGYDIGRASMQDVEIIPLLLQQRRPTFFSRDEDFYKRRLCHARYCLVYLVFPQRKVAIMARRLLRHPMFNTEAKRLGTIIRAADPGLTIWRLHAIQSEEVAWD